jgi:hypothetical protein
MTKPKIQSIKMGSIKLGRLDKIQKNDIPSSCTYDSPKGKNKTMKNNNYSFSFSKKKKTSYLNDIKSTGP